MNKEFTLRAIMMISCINNNWNLRNSNITTTKTVRICGKDIGSRDIREAPPAITGDNVYVAWWTNKTGNDEVMFRASIDKGQTFGEKIDLSNTPNSDSTRVGVESDANIVVATWGETNQTADIPVMKLAQIMERHLGLC
jgi:hypothetical protein